MNILKKCWAILKLMYLYLAYWLVGISEEAFYMGKGNYLIELNAYSRAIRSYKKALSDSNDRNIHAMIGYCHSCIGSHQEAVEYYRQAYKKIPDQSIDINLAISEFEAGNIDESETIINELRGSANMDTSTKETLDNLEARIALVRRERKNLEKYKK
jgi:tetratricopeptide (TPR) repeat protein